MNLIKQLFGNKFKIIALLIVVGLTVGSCHRARYRKMLRKRRVGHINKKTHRSAYQKKLRKSSVSTSSKYYIKKQKRNYRRKPWYNN